jgi:tetratricopeptide (TPR) repeat protein
MKRKRLSIHARVIVLNPIDPSFSDQLKGQKSGLNTRWSTMKKWLHPKAVFFLLIFVLAGCAASSPSGPGTPPEAAGGERNKAAAEATRNVGEAYLSGGNLLAALRELKKAESLYPEDHITQYDIGLVYYYRERYDQAIPYFERAIQLKPDFAPAINGLGNAYSAQGNWDKAIEAYQKIIEDVFYGTPHFALSNMALAYFQKGDYVRAEKHFLEALKLSPDFVNALGGLATTYLAQGRYEEAVQKLERAVRKEPKLPQLRFELGKAYRGLGDSSKARDEFQRAAQLAPDTPLADQAQRELKALSP